MVTRSQKDGKDASEVSLKRLQPTFDDAGAIQVDENSLSLTLTGGASDPDGCGQQVLLVSQRWRSRP